MSWNELEWDAQERARTRTSENCLDFRKRTKMSWNELELSSGMGWNEPGTNQ
jgi:hypothetical protein